MPKSTPMPIPMPLTSPALILIRAPGIRAPAPRVAPALVESDCTVGLRRAQTEKRGGGGKEQHAPRATGGCGCVWKRDGFGQRYAAKEGGRGEKRKGGRKKETKGRRENAHTDKRNTQTNPGGDAPESRDAGAAPVPQTTSTHRMWKHRGEKGKRLKKHDNHTPSQQNT